jgi:hypothetical protein
MPVEAIRDAQNLLEEPDTFSAWSPAVWGKSHWDSIKNGLTKGIALQWDFWNGFRPSADVNAAQAWWEQGLMAFGSAGAPIATVQGIGLDGGVSLGSDGDNEGAVIRMVQHPFKIARDAHDFRFEAVVKTSTIENTKHGFFVGLMDSTAATATVPIAADGTLADVNLVGFHRLEGDGDAVDLVYKANGVTQVTVKEDAGVLVADTYTKFGMTYQRWPYLTEKAYILRWYINGRPVAEGFKQIPDTLGDDFPNDVGLGFVFAVLNATASTPGTSTISRARVSQLLQAA